MDRVDAIGLRHRQEDRRGNDDGRAHVHERAQEEHQDIEEQQDDQRVVRDGVHPGDQGCGHPEEGHQPGESGGHADDEQDHCGGAHGTHGGVNEAFPGHLPVDEDRDEQGVQNGNARALGGREDTGADAAEDDGDQKQARDGNCSQVKCDLEAGEGFNRVAAAASHEICGDHQCECEQEAGNDAGGEKISDGDLPARSDGINDHVMGGRKEKGDQRRHRGHVHGVVCAVTSFLHLRYHQAAHGCCLGNC